MSALRSPPGFGPTSRVHSGVEVRGRFVPVESRALRWAAQGFPLRHSS